MGRESRIISESASFERRESTLSYDPELGSLDGRSLPLIVLRLDLRRGPLIARVILVSRLTVSVIMLIGLLIFS